MLTILLVDSELETIPMEMLNDPAVRKLANTKKKKAQMMLLDSNFLHTSIDRYYPGMSTRRGRPDLFHTFLNVVNESILNRMGHLRIFIHTRNNKVITINPETRVPKSYNRFVGLIEDLFLKGEIKAESKSLLKIENLTAQEAISRYSKGRTVVMWPGGDYVSTDSVVSQPDTTIIMGGFAEGDYISDLSSVSERYSIFPQELTTWTVASELICSYERVHDLV